MPRIIKNISIAVFVVTMITLYSFNHPVTSQNAPEPHQIDSNVVYAQEVMYDNPIEQYIRLKFGVYADKAMQLLTDPMCAENRKLDPHAVNDNRTWGGVGRDRGMFQINDIYHPITDECAFDYKCNTDYAWRMFENDNHTFVRWTCGKYLGI